MPQYVNVRRILLGHKRAAKSPLLEKFLCKCVSTDPANFVGTQELFLEYKNAVEMWTDGDNQAKILLKEKAFQRVSCCSLALYVSCQNREIQYRRNENRGV